MENSTRAAATMAKWVGKEPPAVWAPAEGRAATETAADAVMPAISQPAQAVLQSRVAYSWAAIIVSIYGSGLSLNGDSLQGLLAHGETINSRVSDLRKQGVF